MRAQHTSTAHFNSPAPRRRPDLPGARPVWYRVQTGAACPASGRVCRCVVCCGRSALHLARPVLLPVLCSPSGCAGGWGLHLWGIWREPGVGWSTARIEKIQKRRFSAFPLHTYPILTKRNVCHCASLQKFQKIQKDPSPGLICVILDRKKGESQNG